MKTTLVLLIVIASALADYESFSKKYGKVPKNMGEFVRRRVNYFESLALIESENKKGLPYKLGETEHADRNASNFVKARCKLILPKDARSLPTLASLKPMTTPALPSVDWSANGKPVKAQGDCGSCWAFASVAVLEFYCILRGLPLPDLSQQNLVDCSTVDHACDGGWPGSTFKFVKDNMARQIASIANYPYTSGVTLQPEACKLNTPGKSQIPYNNVTTVRLNNDEQMLMKLVSNVGPVAIAMHITESPRIPVYTAGVFRDYTCPPAATVCDEVNHAVVLVGYGTDATGEKYWKIRNSWGPKWGENGYVRWLRDGTNNCGVVCYAMYIE